MRFGIGAELYSMGANYVKCNEKGVTLEDPQAAYERRKANGLIQEVTPKAAPAVGLTEDDKRVMRESLNVRTETPLESEPPCPKCGGKVWDNRIGKKNPKAPDFKCRDKSCDGVIWPPKGTVAAPKAPEPASYASITGQMQDEEDELPF